MELVTDRGVWGLTHGCGRHEASQGMRLQVHRVNDSVQAATSASALNTLLTEMKQYHASIRVQMHLLEGCGPYLIA
jgi:hypothetical protein